MRTKCLKKKKNARGFQCPESDGSTGDPGAECVVDCCLISLFGWRRRKGNTSNTGEPQLNKFETAAQSRCRKKKERNRQLMMQHKKKKRPRDAQDEANGQGQRTRALRQPKAKAKREEQSWCVLFHPFVVCSLLSGCVVRGKEAGHIFIDGKMPRCNKNWLCLCPCCHVSSFQFSYRQTSPSADTERKSLSAAGLFTFIWSIRICFLRNFFLVFFSDRPAPVDFADFFPVLGCVHQCNDGR